MPSKNVTCLLQLAVIDCHVLHVNVRFQKIPVVNNMKIRPR